jgi:aspartyl-tRNA(Asn)/glutamyl-tRNA(Gln) amidotransferase subunit C
MALTREEVSKIAHLARVGFSDEELDRVGKDLANILGYVDRLQAVDTQGIAEASAPLVLADSFRPDEAEWCAQDVSALVTKNFPESLQGLLKAPAVFDRSKK